MFEEAPPYRSYLLTLWEERGRNSGTPRVWRFQLLDPRTGRRRAFASIDGLAAELERLTEHRAVEGPEEEGPLPGPPLADPL